MVQPMQQLIDWRALTVSEVKHVYTSKVDPASRPKITDSRAVNDAVRPFFIDNMSICEQFVVVALNRQNKCVAGKVISVGGIAGTIADPVLIWKFAIDHCASGLLVAHNHPSGNLKPSQADIDLTKRLRDGGKLLQVNLLDHLILTEEKYYSFADEGMM